MTKPINVLVTGIGGGGHGEQILKSLQLSTFPFAVIGTDLTDETSNRDLVDHFHVVPRADDEQYIDTILQLAKQYDAKVVFHGSEPEMEVLSKNNELFRSEGIYLPINQFNTINTCRNKNLTFSVLAEKGIRVPQTSTIDKTSDLMAFTQFPYILKPIKGGGSAHVYIAQTSNELKALCDYIFETFSEILLQEYIGTPENEYTIGLLFNRQGQYLNGIALRRFISNTLTTKTVVPNRTGRSELGPNLVISSGVSQGELYQWPEMLSQAREIAEAVEPTGPINIQGRWVDGKLIPFEINPRFSGTTSLRAMVGYNEPEILVRHELFGETVNYTCKHPTKILRSLRENIVENNGVETCLSE